MALFGLGVWMAMNKIEHKHKQCKRATIELTIIEVGKKLAHIVAVAVIQPTCRLRICFCYVNKQKTNLIDNICHDNSTPPTRAWMMKRGSSSKKNVSR